MKIKVKMFSLLRTVSGQCLDSICFQNAAIYVCKKDINLGGPGVECYELNDYISPKYICFSPTPKGMLLRNEISGGQLGLDGPMRRYPHDSISVLIRSDQRHSSLTTM